MAFKVYYASKADKEIRKLDKPTANVVAEKILLLNYPFPEFLDIKKIQGFERLYRLRVGEYRVIFEVDKEHKEIWVRRVASRGEVYLGF